MKNIFVCLSLVVLSLIACLASVVVQSAVVDPTSTPTAMLQTVAPTATVRVGEVWVICHNANVRPGPFAEDRVLDWKLKGERVVVLEWVGAWARIGDAEYINGWLFCPQNEEVSRVR